MGRLGTAAPISTGVRTRVTGYRIKDGKLVPCNKHLDVSARLRQRGSKKVRVVRKRLTMPAASRVARFTQADIARAVKGAKKAKLAIASVRIERDGAIVIVPAETHRHHPR